MISLKQPSLILHSHDAPGYLHKMTVTWTLPQGASARDVVHYILEAYDYAPDLQNVVLSSHGARGKIKMGGLGRPAINRYNVDAFGELRGRNIGTIWILSCEVAKGAFGSEFCRRMATASGCTVVAGDVVQLAPGKSHAYPFGYIDYYEGPVYQWDSAGRMSTARNDGSDISGAVEDY
jgi:hypothetical protein